MSGVAAYAIPALGDGNGSEFFVTGSAACAYDSNVFLLNKSPKGDVLTTLTPGIDFPFTSNSVTKGEFLFNEAFNFYSKYSDQNSSLANTSLTSAYDDDTIKASFDASFVQYAQNTEYARPAPPLAGQPPIMKLARWDATHGDVGVEDKLTQKTSLAIAGDFDRTKYKDAGYTSYDVVTVPVSAYFEVTPKLDLSARYEFRYTSEIYTNVNYNDNFVGLGARGELAPKLTGEFYVGAARRDFHGNAKSGNLFDVRSNFTYTFSPKTLIQFGVSRDFDTVATGDSVRYTAGNLSGTFNFTEAFSVNAGVSYRTTDFYVGGRSDKYFLGTGGLTYKFNSHASIAAGYTFRGNASNRPVGFSDNVLMIIASVRF
jgi:hypothetical protein